MHQYLKQLLDSNTVFVDTETDEFGKFWSGQFSIRPGTSAFVHRDQTRILDAISKHVAQLDITTVVHNAPFDIPVMKQVGMIPNRVADTMVASYLLQSEPQGLKALAYRHVGMQMSSFTDITANATRRKALLYLALAVEQEWPDPEPILGFPTKGPKAGGIHVRHPQNISKKIYGILRDSTTVAIDKQTRRLAEESEGANPFKRWYDIDPEDGRAMVEDRMGRMQRGYLQDIDPEVAINYACLSGESRILTEDGYKSIKELVKAKSTCSVWSISAVGAFELKPIVGWYKNTHKENIQWLTIETEHSVRVGHNGGKKGGILGTRYTPDHRLRMSDGSWKCVEDIQTGDYISIPVEELSEMQQQLVIGGLLGDGCITQKNPGGWATFTFFNNAKQLPYFLWKASLSPRFIKKIWTSPYCHASATGTMFSARTLSHPRLKDLRQDAYDKNGRKLGTWYKDLSDLGLAIWYQDDGTLANGRTPRLYTNAFTKKEVQKLQRFLLIKFGVKTSIQVARKDQWLIAVRKNSIDQFCSIISDYVHPCMRYKLPTKYRYHDFVEAPPYDDASQSPVYSKVTRVYTNPPPRSRRGMQRTSYCIDVRGNHNFFTRGEIAHNCMDADATSRIYPILWSQIQSLGLEEVFWADMEAMPICLDMMEAGIQVDVDYLKSLDGFFEEKLNKLNTEITQLSGGVSINPRSPDQVSDLLFKKLKLKTIKRFNKEGYHPTGDEILAQLVADHPVVQKVRDYREYAKFRSTYTEKIPGWAEKDGRVRPTIKMTRTSTGRLCVDPETLIEAPRDMELYPDGIPLHELSPGDWVYSFDHNRELCVKKVKWVGPTKKCSTLIIRYEGERGQEKQLICSEDHLVRRYHGIWMHAKDLKVGHRLLCMPPRHDHGQGYYTFFPHSRNRGNGQESGGRIKEHRFVYSQVYYGGGHLGSKSIIHHKDGRQCNNVPSNLKWLTDRASHHTEHAYGIEGYEEAVRTGCGKNGQQLKLSTIETYKRRLHRMRVQGINHVVTSIEPGPIVQLWDLEIEDTHCFIGNEVALHNSMADPNLQNIPVRKEDSRKIRNGFVAQPGCSLVAIDLSQIELRCFAHFSQDPELLEVYRNGGDIHTKTGCRFFNCTPEELPEYPERRAAKTGNFGIVYDITARGLYERMLKDDITGWTVDDCQGFIDSWLALYNGVVDYRKEIHNQARRFGYVRGIGGRIRYIPGVRCKDHYLVAEALRQAANFPIQWAAAYILKKAMKDIPEVYRYYRSKGYIFNPLLQVHDEIICEIQDELIPSVVPLIKGIMEHAVPLSVPTPAEVKQGVRWGELKPIKE